MKKRYRGRHLVFLIAVVVILAIPAAAYTIAREYWGVASGIRMAIENDEGIPINKKLRYKGWELMIEDIVWEENDLGLTYCVEGTDFRLGEVQIVDDNGNRIDRGYYLSGAAGDGTIDFKNIDLGSLEGDRVWLSIPALQRNRLPLPVAASLKLEVTPAMQKREYDELNKKVKVRQGTFLFKDIYFSKDDLRISYEFTLQAKYREIFSSDVGSRLLPGIRLMSGGQSYGYAVASLQPGNGYFHGTLRFAGVPIEKLKDLQIEILDDIALVDWKIPIPVQNKEAVSLELAEEIELPEGKLSLTGLRQGTKSTAIDFTFEPAGGFERISSIHFDSYLRNNGKYYTKHGFQWTGDIAGLSGTVTFDPVRYDNVEELEFVLGKIEYTYDAEAVVTVSPGTVPQIIEALGGRMVIDQMERQSGKTFLHITFAGENRWFYDAEFKVRALGATRNSVLVEDELGLVQLKDEQELKEGLQRLKDRIGDDDWEISQVNLEESITGKNIELSGEHEEVEVQLTSLSTLRFSGASVNIPVK